MNKMAKDYQPHLKLVINLKKSKLKNKQTDGKNKHKTESKPSKCCHCERQLVKIIKVFTRI